MKKFKLTHLGEDYCEVIVDGKEEIELPLRVAEMFLGELQIDENEINKKELKKFFERGGKVK